MGAEAFTHTSYVEGGKIDEAFNAAVEQAAYEHGHGGYTGTIAEKTEYVVIEDKPLEAKAAHELANKLIDECDARIDSKWGPAGAIRLVDDGWMFFGWASS